MIHPGMPAWRLRWGQNTEIADNDWLNPTDRSNGPILVVSSSLLFSKGKGPRTIQIW
jgi:hypothetical protein